MESDFRNCLRINRGSTFLSTLSAWRATGFVKFFECIPVFLSTLSAWRATSLLRPVSADKVFLSTLSAWRATFLAKTKTALNKFLSTLSAWRATYNFGEPILYLSISIHALRMESDTCCKRSSTVPLEDFYPRSPHGERRFRYFQLAQRCNFYPRSPHGERLTGFYVPAYAPAFLSTLSAWRATSGKAPTNGEFRNFYPRSPHGERPSSSKSCSNPVIISIHALRMESDNKCYV